MAIDTRFMAEYLQNPALQAKYGNFSEFQDFMLSQQPAPFQQPNMFDVAGPINENLRDLGNPLNDPRVVSEEMGLVGINTTMPTMANVAGDINENLIDRGNPLGDSRVVSEEMGLVGGIPDRGRGMAGPAVEMIGGQAVPVGDVLGRQMALEKADFFEEPKSRLDAGGLLSLVGLLTQSRPIQAMAMMANRNKIARGIDRTKSGLGSLGSKLADFRERTTGYRTQAAYEQARTERQQQKRTDRMIDRINKGKRTRSNPRDAGTTKAQKDAISAALQDKQRGAQYGPQRAQGSGGSTKIVCTMINER